MRVPVLRIQKFVGYQKGAMHFARHNKDLKGIIPPFNKSTVFVIMEK